MKDIWNRFVENPPMATVCLVCATVFACALIFGGVSCIKAEYDFKIEMRKLWLQHLEKEND